MQVNESYMHRCLELAVNGSGSVAPNPMVGAVLVYEDRIIGEGYHKKFGEAHAEVNCIASVEEKDRFLVSQSTLYVSLEPCSHHGKTPPCSDLIIRNKIPQVIIGCKDPYLEVDGRGIEKLLAAGIEVITGILENECRETNKRFFTFHQKKRPYVVLKWAESLNGKIGIINERVMISNEISNRLVHKWRNEEQAILVGKQTALKDDPSLTNRYWSGKNPIRCVIDNNLTLPLSLKLFDRSNPTIVFNFLEDREEKNLKYVKFEDGQIESLLKEMFELNIQSLLVEGGPKLLQSFIQKDLWDEIRIIKNEQMVIEHGIAAPEIKEVKLQRQERYAGDVISYFFPVS